MNNYGQEKLRKARQLFGTIVISTTIRPNEALHKRLRRLLVDLRSAMDWLEDTPDFEAAHEMLDQAGRLAREYYPEGCVFPYRDGLYWAECPVALAHNRIGLSTGFIIYASECSVCGNDPEDCAHIRGRVYDGKKCLRIITDGRITDVSYVSRPSQPDCRITSISLSNENFKEKLGRNFVPGVPVTCDRCISPCDGVSRAFEQAYGH